ncbi:MAG TPA: hypothetical protein PKI17_00835 [Syntrophomonas sp.]|nr:hypothetical protein [Syntrophomonas sp.]
MAAAGIPPGYLETDAKQRKLYQIIDEMGRAIPETWEYHSLKYWNSHNPDDISELEKAYTLHPGRSAKSLARKPWRRFLSPTPIKIRDVSWDLLPSSMSYISWSELKKQ